MFAALTRAASRWLELPLNETNTPQDIVSYTPCEDPFVTVDVDVFPELVLPSPDDALQRVAGLCGKAVAPLYRYLEATLSNDVDTVILALHESECHPNRLNPTPDSHDSKSSTTALPGQVCPAEPPPPQHPSDSPTPPVPVIIITPAPPQPREKSCWVPIQDVSFGTRLAVPMHTPINAAHPPMSLAHAKFSPYVRSWRYEKGHWWAVLSAEEQERRCMYSRPCGLRKRPPVVPVRAENMTTKVPTSCRDVCPRGTENRRKS